MCRINPIYLCRTFTRNLKYEKKYLDSKIFFPGSKIINNNIIMLFKIFQLYLLTVLKYDNIYKYYVKVLQIIKVLKTYYNKY